MPRGSAAARNAKRASDIAAAVNTSEEERADYAALPVLHICGAAALVAQVDQPSRSSWPTSALTGTLRRQRCEDARALARAPSLAARGPGGGGRYLSPRQRHSAPAHPARQQPP